MSKPSGNREQLYSTVPGLWSRRDTEQPTLILQIGEDTPGSFVRNEVGKETCRFREVLGGLVWDGEYKVKVIFILDRLDENSALVAPRCQKIGKQETTLPTCCWSTVHGSSVIMGRLTSPRLGIEEKSCAVI